MGADVPADKTKSGRNPTPSGVADTHIPDTKGSDTRPDGDTLNEGPDASFDPYVGRVLLERYRVERRLGAGGMGSVYLAEQIAVNRPVALKILHQGLLANEHVRHRFRREAEMIGGLDHPHTVRLFDYGEIPNGPAVMAMELLNGKALNERLCQGPLSFSEALSLAEQVSRSLQEAHSQGLVHRDLKPANIFLVEGKGGLFSKVLDFGIARLMDESATRITLSEQVFGTPRYMSPEQAISTGDVDHRSDIYSLGIILYECLAGQPPFVAQTSLQYLSAHTQETPPKLSERLANAPAVLEALVDQCLAKDPKARPQSAQALADQLAEIRTQLEKGNEKLLSHPKPRRSSVLGLWAAVFAACLLLGVGLYFGFLRQPPQVISVIAEDPFEWEPEAPLLLSPWASNAPLPEGQAQDQTEVEEGIEARPKNPRPRRPVSPPSKPSKVSEEAPGRGAISGPRGMVIDLGEDSDLDLVDLARTCTRSLLSGSAKLAFSNCPGGCAILVDETCGGRTPELTSVRPGRHDVAVLCQQKVVRTGSVWAKAGQTTRFSCR